MYSSTSKLASTSALILGVCSLVSFALLALTFFVDWDWLAWSGIYLTYTGFGCGLVALYLGIVGLRAAKSEPDGVGLGRSIFASVTGVLVALLLIGLIIAFIAFFIWLMHEYPQG